MLKIHKAYGIPETIVQAIINAMYSNTQAVVLSLDGETDAFEILAGGVLQGDTLGPGTISIHISLDSVMRVAIGNSEDILGFTVTSRRSQRHPAEAITDFDFADYIAFLPDTLLRAQKLLSRGQVERAADTVGL